MIALDRPGRISGYVELHNSTDESAWQKIRLPVHCFNGTPGPTTLVLGGMQGDEYEGPVAIDNLAHELEPSSLTGRLILMPAVNLPALETGRRLSPLDGRNLNREFPGNPRGSLTQRIAHFLVDRLLPECDHVIDLHSGGRSLNFAPCILLHEVAGSAMRPAIEAAQAFAAPFTLVLREDHADVMIDAVVEAQGKVMIASELGGAGTLPQDRRNIAVDGLKACLVSLGHFQSAQPPARQSKMVTVAGVDGTLTADDNIIFSPTVALGAQVSKGDTIGIGHRVDRVDIPPKAFFAKQSGWVICMAGQGLVHRGDVMAMIAKPWAQPRLERE